ncbi:MAG: hypothetical protein KC416_13925, partial [Myxococcales bacterium]|nr:hypothetical protein [Myxococcales bacterium]
MAQETSRGTRWALVALVFLHGGFVGGMIPLLNRELGETAPYAFSLYFAGMLLGQLLLWRIAALASPGWALGAYELFFAAAIVWMATHPSPMGITTGR